MVAIGICDLDGVVVDRDTPVLIPVVDDGVNDSIYSFNPLLPFLVVFACVFEGLPRRLRSKPP